MMPLIKGKLTVFVILIVLVFSSCRPDLERPVIPGCLGVNMPRRLFTEADAEMLALAGFRFIRTDMVWMDIEKKHGVYSYNQPSSDDWVQMCTERDLRLMFILDYGHSMYGSDRAVNTEVGRQAYASFAEATATRYAGHGILWEIWNEPNASVFWKPEPNVDDYVALVKSAAPRIKAADPSGFVVAPAVSGIDFKFLEPCFRLGLLEYIDILSVHPYRAIPPESVIKDYKKLRAMIEEYAPDKKEIPIISGEWGYSLVRWDKKSYITELQQAQYLVRMFLVNMYQDIQLSIWYNWINIGHNADDREHNFGLVTRDRRPKTAFKAARVLIQTLNGFWVEERIDTNNDDDFVLRLKNDDGAEALACWTLGDDHEAVLPVKGGQGSLIEMLGDETPVSWDNNNLRITLSSSPRYLLIDK